MTTRERICDGKIKKSVANAFSVKHIKIKKSTKEFADKIVAGKIPVVLIDTGVENWKALEEWNADYFISQFKDELLSIHIPKNPTVKMCSIVQPMGQLPNVSFTRPFDFQQINITSLLGFGGDTIGYYYAKVNDLKFASDVGETDMLTLPWRTIWETNLWVGSPTVTTPFHYDLLHNFYVQIDGMKRFILIPPTLHKSMYLYPRIHPATRMSQIVIDGVDVNYFDDFVKRAKSSNNDNNGMEVQEILLQPGQVLYIPPYWFHYVTAVGGESNTPSISVSVHTESEPVRIRERLLTHPLPVAKEFSHTQKVSMMRKYIYSIFQTEEECRSFINDIVVHRYKPLRIEKNVTGLIEAIDEGLKSFDSRTKRLEAGISNQMKSHAKSLLALFQGWLQPHEMEIELSNYIEDAVASVFGAANVQAFLESLTVPPASVLEP